MYRREHTCIVDALDQGYEEWWRVESVTVTY
jgi:hypothetical protein